MVNCYPDDKKNYGRRENNKVDNVWTNIKDVVMNFIEPDVNRPNLRSRAEKYNKKPELIQLKGSNEKPSLMYEIESASVLDSLQDVLGSQKARRYSDNIARAAAYVYRLIKEA
ncbi:uncharacterized protein LOC120635559 [Pararge aegeria]|uniref:uncharacterized protein LOC120635559 n=1 Tax=Pararge aegeria TaxID=116150 RepID=UPI0019D0A74E|nr:uncharacterized protein LOC120635559 [Pararge aegeria]